jgi:2'-5' RNA ligase
MTAVATAPSRTQKKKFDYGCLMGMLPESLSGEIVRWTNENINPSHLGTGGFPDYPHITVKYGFTSPYKTIRDQIRQLAMLYGPLTVRLGGFSLFRGNEDGDVLKVDVESEDLHQLNRVLGEQFDTEDKYPTYQPHLTIAYLDPNFSSAYTANLAPFLNQEVLITELDYSCQTGKRESIPLVFPGLGSKGVKASYFAECERDDEGHCLPKGEAGQETSEEDKPIDEEVPSESDELADWEREYEKDHGEWDRRSTDRQQRIDELETLENKFSEFDADVIGDEYESAVFDGDNAWLDAERGRFDQMVESTVKELERLGVDIEGYSGDVLRERLVDKVKAEMKSVDSSRGKILKKLEKWQQLDDKINDLESQYPDEPVEPDYPDEPEPEDPPDNPYLDELRSLFDKVFQEKYGGRIPEGVEDVNKFYMDIYEGEVRELDPELSDNYDKAEEKLDKIEEELNNKNDQAYDRYEKEVDRLDTVYNNAMDKYHTVTAKLDEKIEDLTSRRDDVVEEISDLHTSFVLDWAEIYEEVSEEVDSITEDITSDLQMIDEEDPEPDMEDYEEWESEEEESSSEEVKEEDLEEEVDDDEDISFNLDDYDDKSFRAKGSSQGQPCGRGQNPERDGCIPKEQSGTGESTPSESPSEESQEAPSQPSTLPDDQPWLHTNKEGEVTMVSLPGEDGNREYVTRGQTHFIKTLGDSLQQRIQQITEDGKAKMMDFYHRFFDSLDPDAEDEYLGSDEETVRKFETSD